MVDLGKPIEADLDGVVAVVTGGGRGIGRTIAAELAAAGARVGVAGRDAANAAAAAEEIGGLALPGDIERPEDSQAWVRTMLDAYGRIDLFVNNAGWAPGPFIPFDEEEVAGWWRALEVNVRGTLNCVKAAVPAMLEGGGGRIVNIGSGAAWLPMFGKPSVVRSSHGPSKAALYRMTEEFNAELSPQGVRLFYVCPGPVQTDATSFLSEDSIPGGFIPPTETSGIVHYIAAGRLDGLAGRLVSAGRDQPAELEATQGDIVADDLKTIRAGY